MSDSTSMLQFRPLWQPSIEEAYWPLKMTLAHTQNVKTRQSLDEMKKEKKKRGRKLTGIGTEKKMMWATRERGHKCNQQGGLGVDGDEDYVVEVVVVETQ
ncbi:hypothetical protein PIB30_044318 [Stylosanthes scabra]|uniref:Uncharacterized protein n=1 Tax=Stylosanthes scabra TaxID=79078 RepID=A0ABU6YGH9_9FABA|nr:hypothetical protein [Stylosanthes scabra]